MDVPQPFIKTNVFHLMTGRRQRGIGGFLFQKNILYFTFDELIADIECIEGDECFWNGVVALF